MRTAPVTIAIALLASACAGSGGATTAATGPARPHHRPAPHRQRHAHARSRPARAAHAVAVVTAEGENGVFAVSLPGGRVVRRAAVDARPTTVAVGASGPVVAVSPAAGAVTLLARGTLRPNQVVRDFRSPQIAAVAPGGRWALVSDAAAGTVSALDLRTGNVVDKVGVGRGAHHIAISGDGRRAWVALGETAATIVTLGCADMRRLRVTGRIHPAAAAHDLAFSPGGATVWVTSAARPFVSVLSAASGRLLARIPAGPAPQHVAFGGPGRPRAYITSGYGSSIEMVDPADGRVVRTAAVPYGSFNLAVSGRVLVVSSLLDGRVTELDAATLRRRMSRVVAPQARSVAIALW